MPSSTPPKKYVKINGIMKISPEYKKWKAAQDGAPPSAATTGSNNSQALPIVSNMEDHEKLNEAAVAAGEPEIALSESTSATIEMMQEPEISLEAGMTPDTMVDELGAVLNKYEVPMGLMNKLMMLSEFASLEFIIDDSGSMTLNTDNKSKTTGQIQTRWQEAHERLLEMLEILAYVPFTQIGIEFLNRKDRISLSRQGREPRAFLQDATNQVNAVFARPPSGTTPALEKLQESFLRGQGASIARYFFGDGVPNGGIQAQKEITNIITNRQNPEGNPMTFISCTNEDKAVEWMKDCEEVAPYCSESDDYQDEMNEVLKDQGAALPYSYGFHLICQLVAAMNPMDLDAMDESVPFTKFTLDSLLGIEHNEQSFQHYFNCFLDAQRKRPIEGPADNVKKNMQWNVQDFMRATNARDIPQVQQFLQQLKGMH